MQPINYNLDVANPFQAALQGYQTGAGIQQVQQAQQDQMLKQQQAQQAMQAQQREQARVSAIQQKYANFKGAMTPRDAIEFASTMPAPMVTALKDQFLALGAEAGNKELGNMAGILSALKTNPEVAQNLIQQKIDAATNSGDTQESAHFKALQDIAKTDPIKAYNALTPLVAALGKEGQDMLASVSGAEETQAKTFKEQQLGKKAQTEAEFARPNALQELEKRGWDVKKIASDINIDKQNSRIAAMNAATAKEGNALKRQELQIKVNEAIDKRNETIRTKAADLESATSSIDNMINTADRILQTPKNIIGSAAGPVSSRMPTLTQDTADFEALVETLGSQAFMAQIPNLKGMGALSNAEGEKLQAALQNFNLKQSPEQLLKNVKEAQRIIMKGRKVLSDRYGVPQTIPDTPDVKSTGSDIDALLKKYGG
jgi:hypothetical protein